MKSKRIYRNHIENPCEAVANKWRWRGAIKNVQILKNDNVHRQKINI